MGKIGRTNKSYPGDLKLEAVRLVTEDNLAYRDVAKRLGIQNKTQGRERVNRRQSLAA